MNTNNHNLLLGLTLGPLAHGWLDITLTGSQKTLLMNISYIQGDSLTDVLNASIAMLNNPNTPVWLHLYREPGYYTLILRQSNSVIELCVLQEIAISRIIYPEPHQIAFQTTGKLWDYLAQVQQAFQQIITDYSLEDFKNRWHLPFPELRFREFCTIVEDYRHLHALPPVVAPNQISQWAYVRDHIPDNDDDVTHDEPTSQLLPESQGVRGVWRQLMHSSDSQNRSRLTQTLIARGSTILPELLNEVVQNEHSQALAKILYIIGEMGDTHAFNALLDLEQKCQTTKEKRALLKALSTFHHSDAIYPIMRLLRQTNLDKSLVHSISRYFKATLAETLPLVTQALHDSDPKVRVHLTELLGAIRDPGVVDPLLGMLEDTEPAVRETTVDALALQTEPEIIVHLTQHLKDSSGAVRARILRALAQLASPELETILDQMVYDPDELVREVSLHLLTRIRKQRAIPLLLQFVNDPSVKVQRAVIEDLGIWAPISLLEQIQQQIHLSERLEFGGWSLRDVIAGIIATRKATTKSLFGNTNS